MDNRVQDYLDDKFQSSADLESLDSLLENVKTQQGLLKQQLDQARRDHDGARHATKQHAEALEAKGRAFQTEQGDIDRRLLIVTQSETSDEAVQNFEPSMERLRRLEVASGYVELLKDVEGLSNECISQLGKSDKAALDPYRRLQHLVTSLQPLQEAAEGAAPHLLDHITKRAQSLRSQIQKSFSEDLRKTLKKMQWPKASPTVPLAVEQEWTTNVNRLLDLQRSELQDREDSVQSRAPSEEPPVLLPLEVMIHPLELRFNYHFSGDKPTNRLDKPEYFLSHIAELVSAYSEFVENALQPLLVQHFQGSDLVMIPAFIDATSAFITALLPMLRRKLLAFVKQLSSQQLLSHLVHEVMSFDTTLDEDFAYTPLSPSVPWRGTAYYLLDKLGYFNQWLAGERDFAQLRYQAIIDSTEASELDYDSVAADATKPTKAAIRVNDLLETITDRYRTLSSFSQKMRFLIEIQIAIFDQFHARLHGSLEAFITRTSTIGRTVHGVSRDEQEESQGIKGLDRLCRIFGSAEYLERAMRDWSDDVFFLELWDELQHRAKNRDQISSKLGGLQEIQQKTSAAVGDDESDGEMQGALFDETAQAYHRLRVRSEGIIAETLTYNIREALRPYARINPWASLSSSSAGGSASAELDPALRLIAEYLAFLSRAVGKAPLRSLSNALCKAIQTFLWDGVLLRYQFSTTGAAHFGADLGAICAVIDRFVGAGRAQISMRRLYEGMTLLCIPVRGETTRGSRSRAGESGEDEDGENGFEEKQPNRLGLWEVERLVFVDNESARRVLDEIGLGVLSEGDARSVLGRRVELGS